MLATSLFCMILGGKLDYKVGQYLVKVVGQWQVLVMG